MNPVFRDRLFNKSILAVSNEKQRDKLSANSLRLPPIVVVVVSRRPVLYVIVVGSSFGAGTHVSVRIFFDAFGYFSAGQSRAGNATYTAGWSMRDARRVESRDR